MFQNIGENKLYYLKKNYSNLAQQGSESWLKGRSTRFGGSEIEQVTYSNKSASKLILNKLNQKFKTNLYCWWGNVFENIAKEWLTHEKNIGIHEFGAIPSTNYPVAYSPDGLFIQDNDLILLEIKCPFLQDVVENKLIIKNAYEKQIQMGMQILPCPKTLFAQFKFRKCTYFQLKQIGKYERWFHKEKNRSPEQKELWHGALYWDKKHAIKYGQCVDEPISKIYYSFKENVYEICENFNNGTLMYFKCFYVKETYISKDPLFEEKFNTVIWEKYGELMQSFLNNDSTQTK